MTNLAEIRKKQKSLLPLVAAIESAVERQLTESGWNKKDQYAIRWMLLDRFFVSTVMEGVDHLPEIVLAAIIGEYASLVEQVKGKLEEGID